MQDPDVAIGIQFQRPTFFWTVGPPCAEIKKRGKKANKYK